MLYNIAIFVFVLVCIMLMGIILLQSSKTGGMGSAMGGQAINTAFGGQGADKLLMKITSFLAVSFMVLAIVIGMMENPNSRIDYSNKSTLSRNVGSNQNSNELVPVQDPLPIETKPLDVLNSKNTDVGK
jgi:preprotein translocase subunit SecG